MRGRVTTALLLALSYAVAAQQPPGLTTRTTFTGPSLTYDFPGVEIGVAEYDEGPTGATVFYFPKGVMGAVEVRGGWPGTVNTDGLRLGYETTSLDAVTFAGGSYYGLSATGGVADEIRKLRDAAAVPAATPSRGLGIVPAHVVGGIVFDLGRRFNTIAPDAELGRAAFRARRTGTFPLGARGAGRMTGQGGAFGEREKGGQGGAFRQIGPTKVMAFAVLNGGAVVDRSGNVVVCNHPASAGVGHSAAEHFKNLLQPSTSSAVAQVRPDDDEVDTSAYGFNRATNLFLVVTNQKLSWAALQRVAVQVHTSLARAIQPLNTQGDGDMLYAVSTQEVENPTLNQGTLTMHASEAAWDAVLSAVPQRPERPATRPVTVNTRTLDRYIGDYEFGAHARLTITRQGDQLLAKASGSRSIYQFAADEPPSALLAESDTVFYQQTRWEDRLQFTTNAQGAVTEVVFNPGVYDVRARKIR